MHPEALHAFHMAQAKLAGFIDQVDMVLTRYPPTDNSEEAHYARAVAYFRQPDLQKALNASGDGRTAPRMTRRSG